MLLGLNITIYFMLKRHLQFYLREMAFFRLTNCEGVTILEPGSKIYFCSTFKKSGKIVSTYEDKVLFLCLEMYLVTTSGS